MQGKTRWVKPPSHTAADSKRCPTIFEAVLVTCAAVPRRPRPPIPAPWQARRPASNRRVRGFCSDALFDHGFGAKKRHRDDNSITGTPLGALLWSSLALLQSGSPRHVPCESSDRGRVLQVANATPRNTALRSLAGFTLIELLVALAIIGILAAIALPFYGAYRDRGYEATAMSYLRNWVPAQEFYLHKYGHYADADEQLQSVVGVLVVPTRVPYNFSVDSSSSATERWWGRATPRRSGLRYFYIDQTGNLLGSLDGPPSP